MRTALLVYSIILLALVLEAFALTDSVTATLQEHSYARSTDAIQDVAHTPLQASFWQELD